MKRLIYFIFFVINVSYTNCYSFSLTATPIDESCSGNGKISFSVSNTSPTGTILYIVYLLPDLTTPYATTSNSFLNGLSSGTYRIVARETGGTSFTTEQVDVTIFNTITPLLYTITSFNQACSSSSSITVHVNSGTAVSYEIFNGPVTYPLQSSNSFSNLPVGVYKIRVFDSCGIGVVTTYTVTTNPSGFSVSNPILANTTCTLTDVTQIVSSASGTVIAYPILLQYTIYASPPLYSFYSINQIIDSGDSFSLPISTSIPITLLNQSYTYNLLITDSCNTTFNHTYIVNTATKFSATIENLPCDNHYFTLNTTNFTAPYTLSFTTYPTGFNPLSFNSNYPGPYTLSAIDFGNDTNIVPFGNYSVTITDSCGRTKTITFSIISKPPQPSVNARDNGCLTSTGTITASIPSYTITSAIVTDAPSTYPNPLPDNVSSQIVNGILTLNPVPLGSYTIELVENCNYTVLPITVTIPLHVDKGVGSDLRPGCDLGKGSLKLWSKNGKLVSATLIAAPTTYSIGLPNIISNAIVGTGILYLDDLPSGLYTFSIVDECNFAHTVDITVVGYSITSSSYSLLANCGSFDIPLQFISNGTTGQSFWLQKLINSTTNEWGNPITGVIYPDSSVPNSTNSILLNNLTTNYNLSFNGTFRIVRCFLSYTNGIAINSGATSSVNKSCIEILSPTLSFNQSLELLTFSKIPCSSNGNLDVVLIANGTAPLHYTITQKNGLSYSIDNGNSNVFYGLPTATYTFQVEDSCGNIVNRVIDISTLTSLVLITKPNNMLICTYQITNNEVFDLSSQNTTIFGSQSPSNYTLTYFETLTNAQNNSNAINNITNYNPVNNPATVYARLVYNGMPTCYEITSFDLYVRQNPIITLAETYLFCNQNSAILHDLSHNLPNTTYTWSNGVTGSSITIATPGVTELTLTVTNTYGLQNLSCSTSKSITVVLSELPSLDHIETVDWTEDSNSITIITSNTGAFEYSLDNYHYQDSNTFLNLFPGLYSVYVRDKAGCGYLQQQVCLLHYEKYFTPNGDGFNETWRIPFSENEKDLKVFIYDRYGKIISSFDSSNAGWDGTYNGNLMVADDYWFVIYRSDGRVHKGHFCLKR